MMMRCEDCSFTYRLTGDEELDTRVLDRHEEVTGHTIEDLSPEWTI